VVVGVAAVVVVLVVAGLVDYAQQLALVDFQVAVEL
jgi:hypothetical protein